LNNYFSLYPDLFTNKNLFGNHLPVPLYANTLLHDKGTYINQTNYEFFANNVQNNELLNGHAFISSDNFRVFACGYAFG